MEKKIFLSFFSIPRLMNRYLFMFFIKFIIQSTPKKFLYTSGGEIFQIKNFTKNYRYYLMENISSKGLFSVSNYYF